MTSSFSIVIPAKNESIALKDFLPKLKKLYPDTEIIVINDGSTDNTEEICLENSVNVITHPYSKGNGASIKTGAVAATNDIIVFMDGDGQHNPEDIASLLGGIQAGNDMVIGARQGLKSQASIFRGGANAFYNKLATLIVGHKVKDLTSGFRAVNAKKFREFLHLYPNGFSYPTTSTMAFFRAGYSVKYVPIFVNKRVGDSHLHIVKDGVRFLIIIFKVGTLYSPLKVFLPISLSFFSLASFHYLNTYIGEGRFTNMSALLYITSVLIFMMGLISEQITALLYSKK
jgi:glycosyltransferase involved in cell wall biosynthesis